jgi:hypothetical protein
MVVKSGFPMPQPMPHGPKCSVRRLLIHMGLTAVPPKRLPVIFLVALGSVLPSASQMRRFANRLASISSRTSSTVSVPFGFTLVCAFTC